MFSTQQNSLYRTAKLAGSQKDKMNLRWQDGTRIIPAIPRHTMFPDWHDLLDKMTNRLPKK